MDQLLQDHIRGYGKGAVARYGYIYTDPRQFVTEAITPDILIPGQDQEFAELYSDTVR